MRSAGITDDVALLELADRVPVPRHSVRKNPRFGNSGQVFAVGYRFVSRPEQNGRSVAVAIRVGTSDGLTTYDVGIPVLLWRPQMRRVSDRFYLVADRAERLTRIPVLGRLGWLGMFIYLFMVAVAAVLSGAFLILEWITALAVSAGAFVSRLISRRGFNVQAGLVSYIGAHKPRDGQVRVGPPDKLIVRPVQIVWTCTSLAAAWSTRQLMADHIEAGQFHEIHPAA